MAKYRFVLIVLLNLFLSMNVQGQWRWSIIGDSAAKKLQFENLETKKMESSGTFQDIMIAENTESILSDAQRKTLSVRFLKKNKWGLMNGKFKTLIKPQFEYLEIFVNKIPKLNLDKKVEIQGYLGFKESKFYLFDPDFKNIDPTGFSAVQGLGMDFLYPYQMPEQDVKSILRDLDNGCMYLLHSSPLLVTSKQGKIEKKHIPYTTQETIYYIDSNGEDSKKVVELTTDVFYDQITGASWNIYEVSNRKFVFPQWQDSLKLTYVFVNNETNTLSFASVLDSLYLIENNGLLVNFDNHEYNKWHEKMIIPERYNHILFCLPVGIVSSKGKDQIFDLRNLQKVLPQSNQPMEIFNAPMGVMYFGIRENNLLRLYDPIRNNFYKQTFNEIYPEEYVGMPDLSDIEDPDPRGVFYCMKVKMNQKLGVYHFKGDRFYEIKNLEDVDFSQRYYVDAINFYSGGTKFFIAKSDGKWGMSTLNILETKDSVSVPFLYDSLILEFYNLNDFVFRYLKAKSNNEWRTIDMQNHPIELPKKEEENLLLLKAMYDLGHPGMADYYVLTNPTGKKIPNAIDLSESNSMEEFEFPRIKYTADGVRGGKALVYNNFLRKVVDESLYDSIWMITTQAENNYFHRDHIYETFYQYFNWSNNRHLQDMINSYSFVTIPYFLIFKNGLHAIISDNGNILVPFTKEEIDVSRSNIIREKSNSDDQNDKEDNEEYVFEYIFKTRTNSYSDFR